MASEEAMSAANKGLECPMKSVVTPSRELDVVRGILAKASPANLAKYYKVMTDAGFDSVESLTIDLPSFRVVCPDIGVQHQDYSRSKIHLVASHGTRLPQL